MNKHPIVPFADSNTEEIYVTFTWNFADRKGEMPWTYSPSIKREFYRITRQILGAPKATRQECLDFMFMVGGLLTRVLGEFVHTRFVIYPCLRTFVETYLRDASLRDATLAAHRKMVEVLNEEFGL